MRRLGMMMIVLIGLAMMPAAVIAREEGTPALPPDAGVCATPPPGTPLPAPGSPTAGEIAAVIAGVGDEAPLPQVTPPPGIPGDETLLARLSAAEENLASCFNAGDFSAFSALLTPRALLSEFGMSDLQATPAHSASFVMLRQEIVSVGDAQTHADGRVSADVVFEFEGLRMRARDVFAARAGWLLLDEVFELPVSLVPATPPSALDETTLQNLAIFGFPPGVQPGNVQLATLGTTIAMQPGDSRALVLGVFDHESCGGIGFRCFVPLTVPAAWSVAPADGAQIDEATGLLTIDPATASGSVFTARAAVDDGRHIVETEVHVYTPEGNPLVGYWREVAQLSCDTGAEVAPALPIEELVFGADGRYSVTWTPFESYLDYWGTYSFDVAQGTLELAVTNGNDVPPDVDGDGTFAVDEGERLILTDLWLGSSREDHGPANCGHVFAG